MPTMVYGDSAVAGKGLKAYKKTSKGTIIVEYSGEFIHMDDFEDRFRDGTDIHMITLGSQFLGVDGCIHGHFDEYWYCNHKKVCRHTP